MDWVSTQSSFKTADGPRRVTLIGSTGSIGTQGLDVIKNAPEQFSVAALSGGYNLALLAEQAVTFRPEVVGAAVENIDELATAISSAARAAGATGYAPQLLSGADAATQIAGYSETDVVLNGITGAIGLEPTIAALQAGHLLALANKESLIIGGQVVKQIRGPRTDFSGRLRAFRAGSGTAFWDTGRSFQIDCHRVRWPLLRL